MDWDMGRIGQRGEQPVILRLYEEDVAGSFYVFSSFLTTTRLSPLAEELLTERGPT